MKFKILKENLKLHVLYLYIQQLIMAAFTSFGRTVAASLFTRRYHRLSAMELDLFHNSQTNETRFKQTKRESRTNETRFKRTKRDSQM